MSSVFTNHNHITSFFSDGFRHKTHKKKNLHSTGKTSVITLGSRIERSTHTRARERLCPAAAKSTTNWGRVSVGEWVGELHISDLRMAGLGAPASTTTMPFPFSCPRLAGVIRTMRLHGHPLVLCRAGWKICQGYDIENSQSRWQWVVVLGVACNPPFWRTARLSLTTYDSLQALPLHSRATVMLSCAYTCQGSECYTECYVPCPVHYPLTLLIIGRKPFLQKKQSNSQSLAQVFF